MFVHFCLFDFQKLHQKFMTLQKLVSQLREEIKVKNKTIFELQEKLTEKVSSLLARLDQIYTSMVQIGSHY